MKRYDIVVIGSGPGGYVTAIRGAQLGASVAVVEKESIGGVCLNVGCIPTKTLVRNAEIIHLAKLAEKRGITLSLGGVDMEKTMANKNKVVRQLTSGVRSLLKANAVDVYMGNAVAEADNTIRVEGESAESLQYGKLIAATGSRPAMPPVPGLDDPVCMTSTEILSLNAIPEQLVIIGGGVIGCEFATIFNAFGSKVTIIEMLPRLLPGMDHELSETLARGFKTSGIDVKLETTVERVFRENDKASVTWARQEDRQAIPADCVLVATGRVPNTAGLEALGLETDKGFIRTDSSLRTNNPDVYAIGDVTGKSLLAHAASAMGTGAAENIMGDTHPVDLGLVPSCVYTLPEIGSVGLTEEAARASFGDALVGRFPLAACGKAVAMGETAGMFKLVANPQNHKLVGAHLIGASATEIVAEAAAYIRMGATLADIGSTIHAHPTISECMMEAAHNAEGRSIHLPPPRQR